MAERISVSLSSGEGESDLVVSLSAQATTEISPKPAEESQSQEPQTPKTVDSVSSDPTPASSNPEPAGTPFRDSKPWKLSRSAERYIAMTLATTKDSAQAELLKNIADWRQNGVSAMERRDLGVADHFLGKAYDGALTVSEPVLVCDVMFDLVALLTKQQKPQAAMELLRKILKLAEESEDDMRIAKAHLKFSSLVRDPSTPSTPSTDQTAPKETPTNYHLRVCLASLEECEKNIQKAETDGESNRPGGLLNDFSKMVSKLKSECLWHMGAQESKMSHLSDAVRLFEASKQEALKIGDKGMALNASIEFARALHSLKKFCEAFEEGRRSLFLANETNNKDLIGMCFFNLGCYAESLGDLDTSVKYCEEAVAVANAQGAFSKAEARLKKVRQLKEDIEFRKLNREQAQKTQPRCQCECAVS